MPGRGQAGSTTNVNSDTAAIKHACNDTESNKY